MGRPKKYHSSEERKAARKQWDAEYYRKNQEEIKVKMKQAYRKARARYEREHNLPPKYSYTRPEPINFPQYHRKKRPSRVKKALETVKQQHEAWLLVVNRSPREYLESTYHAMVASGTQSAAEKVAQAAYTKLTVPADGVQGTYYELVELRGEGDASALRAKAIHNEMGPTMEACLDMWSLCAEGEYPGALEYAYKQKKLGFQQW
ncbi:hypothetical protein CYLTODRAFT_477618 [Cylindrobasidium torrendii FP15055 ss-10]|uniref:Uncharacterized protein n=1 Tax=Cylindrobasidium torrendii FP15055 ss-10 TaxID=1314674 RepID=A0A0D7AT68_9AGAR|nr:hypothetical protein CYLTODRAFT_477618 [Cylindrobasidium torrendii FP15055 ss-10]